MRTLLLGLLLACLLGVAPVGAALKGSEVECRASDGTIFKGYPGVDDHLCKTESFHPFCAI